MDFIDAITAHGEQWAKLPSVVSWWIVHDPIRCLFDGGMEIVFQRGFPHHVSLTAEQFCGRGCERCTPPPGPPPLPATQRRREERRAACKHCHGTGRIGGVAGELFATWPTLCEVHLTDLDPSWNNGDPSTWWRLSERPLSDPYHLASDVPDVLYELIDTPETQLKLERRRHKKFRNDRTALDALAAACLRFGRAEAVRLIRAKAPVTMPA